MKYISPIYEKTVIISEDIITASSGQGSITAGNTTISGPSDRFSVSFEDLLKK